MESTVILTLAGTAGMLVCLALSVRPLWPGAKKAGQGWRASTVWSDWLDRKQTLLFNLEDLAHEQRLGKISAEDFSRLETGYKKELVALLDQMDHSAPPAEFERFLLGGAGNGSGAAGPGKDVKACFKCKSFYEESFAFCPKCGAALTVQS